MIVNFILKLVNIAAWCAFAMFGYLFYLAYGTDDLSLVPDSKRHIQMRTQTDGGLIVPTNDPRRY